jgi:hypothetical protein
MLGAKTSGASVAPTLGQRWRAVLRSGNLPAGATVDPVSRWLLALSLRCRCRRGL